jgi:hypothetical protein
MSRSRLDEPCLKSRGSDVDHRLTADGGTAIACVLCPNVVGDLAVNDKTIVDKQFIADVDRRERMDEVQWLWLGRGRLWQTDSQFCAK